MLAFAVCFWGLHSKLSLYHSGATQAASPAAKLLSQKERAATSGDVDFVRPTSLQPQSSTLFPTFLIVAIAAFSLLVQLRCSKTLSTDTDTPRLNRIAPSC